MCIIIIIYLPAQLSLRNCCTQRSDITKDYTFHLLILIKQPGVIRERKTEREKEKVM